MTPPMILFCFKAHGMCIPTLKSFGERFSFIQSICSGLMLKEIISSWEISRFPDLLYSRDFSSKKFDFDGSPAALTL